MKKKIKRQGKMILKQKRKDLILKRIIDLVISGIGLILLFPIFVVIGALIKMDSKGPVFFVQERAGKAIRAHNAMQRSMQN